MAPDEKKRAAIGQWFFEKAIGMGERWGEVYTNDDAAAVSVWFPPGETELTPMKMLRAGLAMLPFKTGLGGVSRFMKVGPVTEKLHHHSVEGRHWYLLALGTKPELQGTGLGSALIDVGAKQADAAGLPCYLETATESNVAFYTKRGFEVKDKADVLGFTLWGMTRQPVR